MSDSYRTDGVLYGLRKIDVTHIWEYIVIMQSRNLIDGKRRIIAKIEKTDFNDLDISSLEGIDAILT